MMLPTDALANAFLSRHDTDAAPDPAADLIHRELLRERTGVAPAPPTPTVRHRTAAAIGRLERSLASVRSRLESPTTRSTPTTPTTANPGGSDRSGG
jgi:hypothetical protein